MSNAKLRWVNFREANLSFCDLSNSDLKHADFSDADLSYADLSNAKLSDTDFTNANLDQANLEGTLHNIHTVFPDQKRKDKPMFKKPESSNAPSLKPVSLPASNHPTANTRQIPQQWEYVCLMLPVLKVADPNETLNNMGILGWELVSTQIFEMPVVGKGRELYFKRPKME